MQCLVVRARLAERREQERGLARAPACQQRPGAQRRCTIADGARGIRDHRRQLTVAEVAAGLAAPQRQRLIDKGEAQPDRLRRRAAAASTSRRARSRSTASGGNAERVAGRVAAHEVGAGHRAHARHEGLQRGAGVARRARHPRCRRPARRRSARMGRRSRAPRRDCGSGRRAAARSCRRRSRPRRGRAPPRAPRHPAPHREPRTAADRTPGDPDRSVGSSARFGSAAPYRAAALLPVSHFPPDCSARSGGKWDTLRERQNGGESRHHPDG